MYKVIALTRLAVAEQIETARALCQSTPPKHSNVARLNFSKVAIVHERNVRHREPL